MPVMRGQLEPSTNPQTVAHVSRHCRVSARARAAHLLPVTILLGTKSGKGTLEGPEHASLEAPRYASPLLTRQYQ